MCMVGYLICADAVVHSEAGEEDKDEKNDSLLRSHGWSVGEVVGFEEDEHEHEDGEEDGVVVF